MKLEAGIPVDICSEYKKKTFADKPGCGSFRGSYR